MPISFQLWKSKAQVKEEYDNYERWAFPHGAPQRTAVEKMLADVYPKNSTEVRLIQFLTAKELLETAEKNKSESDAARHLVCDVRKYKHIIRKGEMPLLMACVIADRHAGAELEYPETQDILAHAESLTKLTQ